MNPSPDLFKLITALPAENRALLAKLLAPPPEPIAIIGMACRFPGGANSPEAFWSLVQQGQDAVSETPQGRWPAPTTDEPLLRWGGFLDAIDQFDPEFFGIAPREANAMDPQQRLLLEVGWEALENAGQPVNALAGSLTGVFVGVCMGDYGRIQFGDVRHIDAYSISGTAHSIVPNRLSYVLDLQGPSITVDTACSSSLVALHLACQSLRTGESTLALAGGVNLILSPEPTLSLAKWGVLSPDGRCKTFDASANGFVRGEGCGMVVLKRLSDAQAHGDPILALIHGSAVNQDGRSNGLTAPNVLAQQAVIRQALQQARVKPHQISYIEAHGTGTALGDPIELEALAEIFRECPADHVCAIGAVKTNIGHLESAAGIAGVIKTVLALQHQCIPPTLHFNHLNPNISLGNSPFVIPTTASPWARTGETRYAGISAFGFGGTNAHVILSEAPPTQPTFPSLAGTPCSAYLLPLSARSPDALVATAHRYQSFLRQVEPTLADIGYAVSHTRSHHAYRLALIGQSKADMLARLTDFLNQESHPKVRQGRATGQRFGTVFVFGGQGTQWVGMGQQLLREEPVFRAMLERCDAILFSLAGWSLLAELAAPEATSRLAKTAIAQPALFAIQVGLAELWKSWGVRPDAVLGHSVGEIAAAQVAGVFSLEEAMRVVYHRGRLLEEAAGLGKMLAVGLSPSELAAWLPADDAHISLAAVNSPRDITLAGEEARLASLCERLQAQGIFCRWLPVDYPFHSAPLTPLAARLREALADLQWQPPQIPLASTVTGALHQTFDAAYWSRNLRETVNFAGAATTLIEQGYTTWLEISAHPVLSRSLTQLLDYQQRPGTVLASLRRAQPEQATLLEALATFYTVGYPIAWRQLYPARHQVVRLPNYAWQRQRYWLAPLSQELSPPPQAPTTHLHPLVTRRLPSPLEEIQFESQIDTAHPSFLGQHCIHQRLLWPAAAYVELMMAVTTSAFGVGAYSFQDVILYRPLVLDAPQTVQIILRPDQAHTTSLEIFSLDRDGAWRRLLTGKVQAVPATTEPQGIDIDALPVRQQPVIQRETFYQLLREHGVELGPDFQGVEAVWQSADEILGRIQQPDTLQDVDVYYFHPALLDACFQTVAAALYQREKCTYLPVGLEQIQLYRQPGSTIWCHVHLYRHRDAYMADLRLYNAQGEPVAQVNRLTFKAATEQMQTQTVTDWLYTVDWQRQPLPEQGVAHPPDRWLIFADRQQIGHTLADALAGQGYEYLLITPGTRYQQVAPNCITLDPTCPEDFRRLFREHPAKDRLGIVHLWSLDGLAPLTALTPQTIELAHALSCGSVLALVQAVSQEVRQDVYLWLITQHGQMVTPTDTVNLTQAALWGQSNVIRLEHPELHCVNLDLDLGDDVVPALLAQLRADSSENQIAFRGVERYVARLVPYPAQPEPQATTQTITPPNDAHCHLVATTPGLLDSLVFQPTPPAALQPNQVAIKVYATGLNFRDVLTALGVLPSAVSNTLGNECVGRVVAVGAAVTAFQPGDLVMALATPSFGNFATTEVHFVAHKPAHITIEEAATLPIAFLTAYYALYEVAHLQPGERILIHAATGGVGLAAVQLAQQSGAEIYATAGSPTKRAYLQALGITHVFDSRSLAFAAEIRACTQSEGVDVVLNAMTGEAITQSLSLLRRGGRFVELGKTDIWTPAQVAQVNPQVTYRAFDLGTVCQANPALPQMMYAKLIAALTDGHVQPLPRKVFAYAQIVDAFRYMAQARHIGKVVVAQRERTAAWTESRSSSTFLQPDATYLITGGLGGLGLRVAQWMVEQGARHLVLLGRRAPSETTRARLHEWTAQGAQILVKQVDIAQFDQVAAVMTEIEQTLPPLRGVIHAAGILDDGVLQQQDWSRFVKVMKPKVAGAWNLHTLTRNHSLRFFVMFSSVAATLGAIGQGNYAAANAFLDALAQARQAAGLPAVSINWGPWAEVGMAAALDLRSRQRIAAQGVAPLAPQQGVDALQDVLTQSVPQVTVFAVQWQAYEAERSRTTGAVTPLLATLIRQPAPTSPTPATSGTNGHDPSTFINMLKTMPDQERSAFLINQLSRQVERVLGLSATHGVEANRPLHELGLDSLTAIELRNRVEAEMAVSLPGVKFLAGPSISEISALVLEQLADHTAVSASLIDELEEGVL